MNLKLNAILINIHNVLLLAFTDETYAATFATTTTKSGTPTETISSQTTEDFILYRFLKEVYCTQKVNCDLFAQCKLNESISDCDCFEFVPMDCRSESVPYEIGCPDGCGLDEICVRTVGVCRKKAFPTERCDYDAQCEATTMHSYCGYFRSQRQCLCRSPTFENNGRCDFTNQRSIDDNELLRISNDFTEGSKTALEIYKITMIFASTCLALILLVFLGCILRKSYFHRPHSPPPLESNADVFTVFPDSGGDDVFNNLSPPYEKPPTYDETIRSIQNEIGIPPPVYSAFDENPNSSNTMSTSSELPRNETQPSTSNNLNILRQEIRPMSTGHHNIAFNDD